MKKPIDPNLDNLIDDALMADDISNAEVPADEPKIEDNHFTAENFPEGTSRLQNESEETQLSIETVDKSQQRHHHHHHSSNSSSAHHSSGSSSGHHHSSGSSSSHHHSSKHHSSKKKKKKLSTSAKIAIAVLLILLFLILAIVFTVVYLESHGKSDMKNVSEDTSYEEVIEYKGQSYVYNDDVISIAFIGVDKRDLGLEDGVVGTAGQADADVLFTVNTQTGRVKVIAVPRDTMVDVDLYSESGIFLRSEELQLCLSYAYGDGKESSAQNVTTSLSRILYDVPVNKYFALDLNGIAPINDAIGGVTVTSLYDFDDIGVKKGDEIHLEGDLTEKYVRTRDLDTVNASLNRTARQVQYIKAFAGQVVPAVMQDFSIISSLYNTAADYSTTNLSLSNATYLASLLISKGVTDFETVTLEGEMVESDKKDYADFVYAEFYPDEDKLMEVVLDTFYTKQEK
ncbi:MAG: LCP family protein [Eubacteriales bacterium]|nr:LCP family protein [Eubacteriales bacterium]